MNKNDLEEPIFTMEPGMGKSFFLHDWGKKWMNKSESCETKEKTNEAD